MHPLCVLRSPLTNFRQAIAFWFGHYHKLELFCRINVFRMNASIKIEIQYDERGT